MGVRKVDVEHDEGRVELEEFADAAGDEGVAARGEKTGIPRCPKKPDFQSKYCI